MCGILIGYDSIMLKNRPPCVHSYLAKSTKPQCMRAQPASPKPLVCQASAQTQHQQTHQGHVTCPVELGAFVCIALRHCSMSLDGVDLKMEMCWKMFPKNYAMRDDHIVIEKKRN